jgi:transcriptional regulator with XRE-family HTH domain
MAETTQPPLLPDATGPAGEAAITRPRHYFLRKLEDEGLFTGKKLQEISPERFDLVISFLSEGVLSQRQIAKVVGVSPNTVRAISQDQTGSIDALRARLLSKAGAIEEATLERIQEILDTRAANKLELRELAAVLREVGNRSDLLAGRRTSIVEHQVAGGTDALTRANAERRARLRAMEAQAVEGELREPAQLQAPVDGLEGTHIEIGNAATRGPDEAQPGDLGADPDQADEDEIAPGDTQQDV